MGRLGQRDRKGRRECSDSLAAEPWAGWVSGIERDGGNAATHFLQSRGQAGSAGWKGTEWRDSLAAEPWVGQRDGRDRKNAATHELQSRGQVGSAGLKGMEGMQRLTS